MRVWITAVGIVSPLACNAQGTFDALVEGRRAQQEVTLFDVTALPARLAAEVRELSVRDVAPRGTAQSWSRTDAMAVTAGQEAMTAAGLPPGTPVSLIVGGTTGGMFEAERHLVAMLRDAGFEPPRAELVSHPISAPAGRLREAVWPFDRVLTVCSACSSGANAIALGEAWIRSGRATRVLAGGADALCRTTFVGFNLLKAMDRGPCRPFDAARAGMNLGEGAAFVLLERSDLARARGVAPIAELAGWAIGSEAAHITQPEPDGKTAARLLRQALARARIGPRDVGYVNAHGTATLHNDRAECAALRTVFGDELARIPVSSVKGQLGHTLGAAGAIELAVTALALREGVVPPTGGLTSPDAECALDHVMGRGRPHRFCAALSTSFGFGGSDTVLALTEPEAFEEPMTPPRRRVVITAGATLAALGTLTGEANAAYLADGALPSAGSTRSSGDAHLDPVRARRLDDAAASLTAAALLALDGASFGDRSRVGIVNGLALRLTDSAQFLAPVLDRGYAHGKPALFPNLLLSSPAGHATIYLDLHGPALTVSDLGASGGLALASAADLIVAGEADAMVAGATSRVDALLDRGFGAACLGPSASTAPRTDGANALLLEAEETAVARGARVMARVASWESGVDLAAWHPSPPAATARSWIVLPREDDALVRHLEARDWAGVAVKIVASRSGDHEAVGSIALVAATAAIAAGLVDDVLVVERAPGRWVATRLVRDAVKKA